MAMEPQSEATDAPGRLRECTEARILLVGCGLALAYAGCIALTYTQSVDVGHNLLSMTGAHLISGRFGGIQWGYTSDLHTPLVICANFLIEIILVMIFYPLFVLSYRKLIVIGPLQERLDRIGYVAEAQRGRLARWGILGLLLFVWFPFWMTGPLVGCVIGFLIGLRPWVNLATVIAGTGLAVLCWGVLLRGLHDQLERIGPFVPFLVVAVVMLVAVSVHVRLALHTGGRGADVGGEG